MNPNNNDNILTVFFPRNRGIAYVKQWIHQRRLHQYKIDFFKHAHTNAIHIEVNMNMIARGMNKREPKEILQGLGRQTTDVVLCK
jgi:hypothetical protein